MLIRSVEFDAIHLRSDQREAAYIGAIDGLVETEFLADCEASFRTYMIADQRIVWLKASPRRSERTLAAIARDGRQQITFQHVIEGRATVTCRNGATVCGPGSLLILDLSQPYVIEDAEHRTVITLAVPRKEVARLMDDPGKLHGRIICGGSSDLLAGMMTAVATNMAKLTPGSGLAIATAFTELISVLVTNVAWDGRGEQAGAHQLLSERVLRLIHGRVGYRDLTPDWIARQLGISRSQLYAMFDGQGGISKLIWQIRLECAREALSKSDDVRRVGDIAFATGFATESHFARAFKKAFGVSPTTYRASCFDR